tara:strand:+ start:69569 stop:71500 length:1932 start_codon:yes stop_codon:yes gene_type:complete
MSKAILSKERKKKVLYHSDFALLKTGFGKVSKHILSHLYKTSKYDIVQLCCGLTDDNPQYTRVPWECVGAMPNDPEQIKQYDRDPKLAQMASYGAQRIDELVNKIKPDVYIGVQDIWGVDFAVNKKWFPYVNSAIWTTLDSLPILPTAVEASKKVDNFWIWSNFATEELKKLGQGHVKTVRGPLDHSNFFRLKDQDRLALRKRFGIADDAFVVGFVFRNQLRKSVPNLLKGYKLFRDKNKNVKSYLLLHTHFAEGWNIHKLADEHGVNKEEILCTYVCRDCGSYIISPFKGQDVNCPICNGQKTVNTTSIAQGATEEQLNQIYNLMDVYCHPFTSGGQEIPIQEAKLTELITLVTNYSCGVDACAPEAASLPLDWAEYREQGTEFIKASTKHDSIAKNLQVVYDMTPQKRLEMGKKGREWVIENFSIETIGKHFEDYIDSCELVEDKKKVYAISKSQDPKALVSGDLPDREWIIALYKNILDMRVTESDEGFRHWMAEMNKGMSRNQVEEYFRSVAQKEILSQQTIADFVDKEDKGRRILYVIPESAGDVYMATSLFDNLKKQYADYNLYVATSPQYFDIVEGHPLVHKVIPFIPRMEDIHYLEGKGDHEGFFEIAFLSYVNAQRVSCYTHNSLDKIAFDIKS